MSSECRACTAPAELFLCRLCTTTLRDMLTSLHRHPSGDRDRLGLLEYLHDEAIGQRVRSDHGRHVRSGPKHLDGDAPLVSLIQPFPNEKTEDLAVAREERHQAALRRALAAGKVNSRASDEYDKAANALGTWVRHIAGSRGVEPRPLRTVGPAFIGPLRPAWRRIPSDYVMTPEEAAEWLSYNVFSIAYDEAAGEVYVDIFDLVTVIEKMINPPVPIRFLALCPTWFTDKREICGKSLRASDDDIETYCRTCRTTHKCDWLRRIGADQLRERLITWEQLLAANKEQPDDYRVPERTLRHWRSEGHLANREWRRADGSHGRSQLTPDDIPLYKWEDVEKLRADGAPKRERRRAWVG
jgi:hypothetical protein